MRNKSPPLLPLWSRVIGVNLEVSARPRVLSFENETSCLKDQIFLQILHGVRMKICQCMSSSQCRNAF